MKLSINATPVTDTVLAKGFGTEGQDARIARMIAFGKSKANQGVLNIGKLLAITVEGRTLASMLVAGESIHLEEVTYQGVALPIAPDTYLSLATVAQWGCPACGSAHGSGTAPSRNVDARLLASNVFYYRVADQSVFTVSTHCFDNYVKGLGFARNYQGTLAGVVAQLEDEARRYAALEAVIESRTVVEAPATPTVEAPATPTVEAPAKGKGKANGSK